MSQNTCNVIGISLRMTLIALSIKNAIFLEMLNKLIDLIKFNNYLGYR